MTVVASTAGQHGSSGALLTDLVLVVVACVVFGIIAKRLRVSILVGYLIAGLVIGGPSSLRLVDDIDTFSFMGEIGVALLLFAVGLDLSIRKVRRFGRTALVAGTAQVALSTLAAMGVSVALGTSVSTAFVVGVAVSMSSTALVIRVLADRAESDSVHGLVSTGVLIAQDLVVVVVLLIIPLLPGAQGLDQGSHSVGALLAVALGKLVLLLSATFLIERVLMRRLFRITGYESNRELLSLASFAVPLGAIAACVALDLSPALGAFIAGIVMADADYAAQVRVETAPIRMALTAVFFAYIGMLADATWVVTHLPSVLGVVVALILVKAVITVVSIRVAGIARRPALLAGVALAQLGEFSFAVLMAGRAAGLVDDDQFRLLVSASLLTLMATPSLMSIASRIEHERALADGSDVDIDGVEPEQLVGRQAIVVGAGPAGRAVMEAFAANRVATTVIELNPRASTGDEHDDLPTGTRVVFGDASHAEILVRAGIASAVIVVVTIPDPVAIQTIVAQAHQIAPDIAIVARGRYHLFVDDIREAGAQDVVDEEHVTGDRLAHVAMTRLAKLGVVDRRRAGTDRRTPPRP